jgi:arylsulfatase A-like enzyme
VSDLPVYTVDLAPTLAGLAGVPVPSDLDGGVVWR